jgi:hypothetical protein
MSETSFVFLREGAFGAGNEAANLATEKCGDPVGDATKGYQWTKIFNQQMTRLAKPLLNQSGNGRREQKAI